MATTAERLIEAETALHNLSTGRSVVSVSKDGRTVSYSSANRGDLERYINSLKDESATTTFRRGPMGVR